MKIAILGAGAMGCIYGAKLCLENEVYLVGRDQNKIDTMAQHGITLTKDGANETFFPNMRVDTSDVGQVDLIIVFVKALATITALDSNKHLIGPDTYIMTLQNGSGHEDELANYVDKDKIIIGTTEDSGTVLGVGHVRHGGKGVTNIGMLDGRTDGILAEIKQVFDECGFDIKIFENIHQLIWNKLMINSSLSVVTGLLQVKMGLAAQSEHTWAIIEQLCDETIEVGTAMGLKFDRTECLEKIKDLSINIPLGITSICVDLHNGAKTEINTISGSVVRAAEKYGIDVPTHKLMVMLVKAMEDRTEYLV